MTREERKPTGLLHSADELKQLIVENPDLPILVFAGDYANNGDYPLYELQPCKCGKRRIS